MAKTDSEYLAHFTRTPRSTDTQFQNIAAPKRLVKILREKRIVASNIQWSQSPVVCFSECPWHSLLRHAKKYSSFGIGFTKEFIHRLGGNPVFYIRPALYRTLQWPEDVKKFLTPYVPNFEGNDDMDLPQFNHKPLDYSHEREWRLPHDLTFEYDDISFVVLNTAKSFSYVGQDLIEAIGIKKFILMDTYKQIERLWPTHIVPR